MNWYVFAEERWVFYFQNILIEPSLESFNQVLRAEYLPVWEERRRAKSMQGECSYQLPRLPSEIERKSVV